MIKVARPCGSQKEQHWVHQSPLDAFSALLESFFDSSKLEMSPLEILGKSKGTMKAPQPF
jgi:hypothetical protein